MTYAGDGIDRVVSGKAPLDMRAFHCVGYDQDMGEKYESAGSCVKTDKDGDRIFYTWSNSDWAFTEGTGKYEGLTGKGAFKGIFRSGLEHVARYEGEWEIK